jgi:ABC-type polysaccharide/polyol phosphate export permease
MSRNRPPLKSSSFYDSSQVRTSIWGALVSIYNFKYLIKLLVVRDVSVRYKRSVLGIIWVMLNPLLTTVVIWFVFSKIFGGSMPGDVQYAPYVLSGILFITLFGQGLSLAAESIANAASILTKVYLPPQIFTVSATLACAVNFSIGLIALFVINEASGGTTAWTAPLTLLFVIFFTLFIAGLGLILSVAFIRFDDVRNIIGVVILFLTYLSPIFYPISILQGATLFIVRLNPLTSFIEIFRFLFFGVPDFSPGQFLYVLFCSCFSFVAGVGIFTKFWPRTAAML